MTNLNYISIRYYQVFILACCLLVLGQAQAIPSFARQTGQPCSSCHVQSFGQTLTPYGRAFKLGGYTDGDASSLIPISIMAIGSFTHTDKRQPGGAAPDAAPDFDANDNFSFDEGSVFYGGRIWSKLGTFTQITYSGIEDAVAWDNVDIRLANQFDIMNQDIVAGVSFNNSPTVQDVWNTTPVWGFPYTSSELAPSPSASTLIEDGLAQQVGGATAYAMINDHLYLEAGAYATLSADLQRAFGVDPSENNQIDGGAPYWRVVLQNDFDGHYFALGTFGLRANVFPGRERSAGTDHYTDLGADFTYQYLADDRNIFELKTAYIRENKRLSATQALGDADNADNHLYTFRTTATYTYARTYAFNFGYFNSSGSRDYTLYGEDSINGKPDSEGFISEIDFTPFGKQDSTLFPWLNLRFAVQYVAYTKFNGAKRNYDEDGRDASDNNTLFLNGWLIF